MEEKLIEKQVRAKEVFKYLKKKYPQAKTELVYENEYQFFVAVLLSAQTTDRKVNEVTPEFFSRFPDFYSLATSKPEDLYPYLQKLGLYRVKSKNLIASAKRIVEVFHGSIPQELDLLMTLPGIGRKSANVLLGNLFGQDTITVDTHVARLSRRLGFTDERAPERIEFELMKVWPKGCWTDFSHCLILHGRRVCKARNPRCEECLLVPLCPKIGVEKGNQGGEK